MGYTPGAPYGGPSRYFGSDANIDLKCASALIQLSLCADTDTEKYVAMRIAACSVHLLAQHHIQAK